MSMLRIEWEYRLIWVFFYIHTLSMRTVKAMARMRICAGSPEPSLLGYMICAEIS